MWGSTDSGLGSPLSFPEHMNRWTAKFLLLVLLAGMFAPLRGRGVDARRSLRAQTGCATMPCMPGCHHHEQRA